ncbi:aminotransferase class I/II-fold pyridoxal phosphate-dependent enzyme [Nostoc sp. FACHB-145]|uniref:aminotransferase class I/II-fold pyridoxal phosphate-dependent enzyme n=1 Tax=Nostoc sp. FACHB-145 TaxID=2692836 RepID=UPI001683D1D7|nr:aminotransferase class I/II-fold pyridoxal phosphate-dependent enzyme [Nostoc sp. FACHB-145]MBD2472172.1 aminotransferase class I/II-fold pyridoxal phosphate-dependent enzyme [Nostoc sp. FACHB-145]
MSNPTDKGKAHYISPRLLKNLDSQTPISKFYTQATYMNRRTEPQSIDLSLGDAYEMPPPGFVEALQHWVVPQNSSWYGYKANLSESQLIVSTSLKEKRGLSILSEDILMTNGTAVGLAICLRMLAQEGDEVIILTPPWLGYRNMINLTGATAVGVPVNTNTFDMDLEAIASAITQRTRALIVNSPHNPTGKIFSTATLERLAAILTEASHRYGNPIYIISDESFSRVVFDHQACPSPTQFYPFSFLVYGYSKTLMAPGQRIGYIALPSIMPNREQIKRVIGFLQRNAFGWCYPSVLMQYALGDLEQLNINMEHLQTKRDLTVKALRDMGYKLHSPDGTFFLLVQAPWKDDCSFAELLASHNVFVFPGTPLEIPGYFRISLTATEDMLSRALPKFQAALKYAGEKSFRDTNSDLQ